MQLDLRGLFLLAAGLAGGFAGPASADQAPACGRSASSTPTRAFDGAEGFARHARGGRGGRVYTVDRLDDDGVPGSLRHAVEARGARTIVFAVAGTIALRSPLRVEQPRLTIAGHSAPGEGITLRDQPLVINADEVIVRYLRSRLGDASGVVDGDAVWIAGGHHVILDHVSASWSTDETLSIAPRRAGGDVPLGDISVQWSMISESLNASNHPKGAHGYGSLVRGWRGSRFSFSHNLWAHHRARMPRPGNYLASADDTLGALMDFRNNVFHNWGASPVSADGSPAVDAAGYDVDADSRVACNFIGNAYRRGADSRAALAFFEANRGARAHFSDNTMDGHLPRDPWALVRGGDWPGYRQASPIGDVAERAEPAARAERRVLAGAGASFARDAVDRRVIEDLRAGRGRLIDSQDEVGGWPELRTGPALPDSDGDGMPDAWERRHGLDPLAVDDGRPDRDGFTALERYLEARLRGRD